MSSMHHMIGQSIFDVDGDEASGETFYVFHGSVGATPVSGHERYVDYFRRIQGTWKLAYRRVVLYAVPAGDDVDALASDARQRRSGLRPPTISGRRRRLAKIVKMQWR